VYRCEPEDLEPTDCKAEDTNYHGADGSHWSGNQIAQPSPTDTQYGNGSLYPVSQNQHVVSGMYNRVNHHDRWAVSADNGMRVTTNGMSGRHDVSWSSNTPPHQLSRRRDSSLLSQTADSWTSLHSQTSRWQNESHDSAAAAAGSPIYVDRTRVRSSTTGSGYEHGGSSIVSHRRDSSGGDNMMTPPNLGGRYFNGHAASHRGDGALPRLAWLPQDSSDIGRDNRPHSGSSSFTASPPIPFSHNYHAVQQSYGQAYDSSGMLSTPTLHSTSPQPADLPGYDTSYASGSGAMSSPEEYPKLEEFGDSKLT
jgi:hypothetical protein